MKTKLIQSISDIVPALKQLSTDPLAMTFIAEWKCGDWIIRFNGGDVQLRRDADKYFSFGTPVNEFLENLPSM